MGRHVQDSPRVTPWALAGGGPLMEGNRPFFRVRMPRPHAKILLKSPYYAGKYGKNIKKWLW